MNSSVVFGSGLRPEGTATSKGVPTLRVPVIQRVAAPQVELSMRCDAATWLFAELEYDGVAFDPFDPVQGCSELGHGRSECDAPWL